MAIKQVRVKVNNAWHTLTYNSSKGVYEGNLSAPNITSYNVNSGHYYPVTVEATNMAGTVTTIDDTTPSLGAGLKLFVRETMAPTITITAPTASQYLGTANPEIAFTITEETNGSGVAISTLKIELDGTTYTNTSSGVTASAITNGYSVKFIPATALKDGSHTVKVTVADNDGNSATSSTISFTTDTIAPVLNVTSPTDGEYVSEAGITVTGTTSDSTSGVPTITIKLNGVDQGSVTVSNGSFSKPVTLASGTNTLVITATDKAGRVTTITRTVTLDTSTPVIASVVIDPNPVNVGASYTVTVTVE